MLEITERFLCLCVAMEDTCANSLYMCNNGELKTLTQKYNVGWRVIVGANVMCGTSY